MLNYLFIIYLFVYYLFIYLFMYLWIYVCIYAFIYSFPFENVHLCSACGWYMSVYDTRCHESKIIKDVSIADQARKVIG